ncbi:hypothetical protein V8C26DRAFT_421156 [Trichoderma gracile]
MTQTTESDPNSVRHENADDIAAIEPVHGHKGRLPGLSSTWWIEIVTMFTSVACMAGLVFLLAHFENKLSSEWSFFISFNATVAILITAARATLLAAVSTCLSQEKWMRFRNRPHRLLEMAIIDTASRGPLGSLRMLFQISWGFASLSAIVVILSLLTDTFAQQVVHIEPGTVYTHQEGSATFGYAHGFRNPKSVRMLLGYSDLANDTPSAVIRGLRPSGWTSAFNCTSNCTWDQSYITLGFTSTCKNVLEETLADLKCDCCTDISDTQGFYNGFGDVCNMTSPSGVQLNFIPRQYAIKVLNSTSLNDEAGYLNGSALFNAAFFYWDPKNDDYGHVTDEKVKFETLLRKSAVIECALGISLYNYSSISSTSNNFTIGTTDEIYLGRYTGIEKGHMNLYSSPEDKAWWNDTGNGLPDVYLDMMDLKYLVNFFHSPAFCGTTNGDARFGNFAPGATAAFANGSLEEVSSIFDSIALSLTDMVREGKQMKLAQGKTSQAVLYIRVRWRWLILPLVVQFLGGMALLGAVVAGYRAKEVPLWKGSVLAVLYHSVDKDGMLRTEMKDIEELEKVETTKAMLGKKSVESPV